MYFVPTSARRGATYHCRGLTTFVRGRAKVTYSCRAVLPVRSRRSNRVANGGAGPTRGFGVGADSITNGGVVLVSSIVAENVAFVRAAGGLAEGNTGVMENLFLTGAIGPS